MNEVVKEASEKYKDVLFLMVSPTHLLSTGRNRIVIEADVIYVLVGKQIEADVQDEIADSFDIEEVPTFLILRVSPMVVFPYCSPHPAES